MKKKFIDADIELIVLEDCVVLTSTGNVQDGMNAGTSGWDDEPEP